MKNDFDSKTGEGGAGGMHSGETGLSSPPADFLRYIEAVQPDRVRPMSVLFDVQDRCKTGWPVQGNDGVAPALVDWQKLYELEAKRPADGGREQIFAVPLSAHVHHILVDDVSVENLKAMKAAGFRPSVVIASSPGSHQIILNVPKLTRDPEMNREIENYLTHRLNWRCVSFYEEALARLMVDGASDRAIKTAQQHLDHAVGFDGGLGFGDPQLYGSRHPMRMPGMRNQKTKHLRPDGTYPVVVLVEAHGGMCPATLVLAEEGLRREMERLERRKRHDAGVSPKPKHAGPRADRPAQERAPASPSVAVIWEAHRRDILRINAGATEYQIDVMIAQRLRATGHCFSDIEAAVEGCSTAKYTNGTYPRRVADKALNIESDMALAGTARYHDAWRRLEGRAVKKLDREAARREKVEMYLNAAGGEGGASPSA
jgi:hypothetical protein